MNDCERLTDALSRGQALASDIAAHAESCPRCRRELDGHRLLRRHLSAAPEATAIAPSRAPAFAVPPVPASVPLPPGPSLPRGVRWGLRLYWLLAAIAAAWILVALPPGGAGAHAYALLAGFTAAVALVLAVFRPLRSTLRRLTLPGG